MISHPSLSSGTDGALDRSSSRISRCRSYGASFTRDTFRCGVRTTHSTPCSAYFVSTATDVPNEREPSSTPGSRCECMSITADRASRFACARERCDARHRLAALRRELAWALARRLERVGHQRVRREQVQRRIARRRVLLQKLARELLAGTQTRRGRVIRVALESRSER